jgi:hypothetical protein
MAVHKPQIVYQTGSTEVGCPWQTRSQCDSLNRDRTGAPQGLVPPLHQTCPARGVRRDCRLASKEVLGYQRVLHQREPRLNADMSNPKDRRAEGLSRPATHHSVQRSESTVGLVCCVSGAEAPLLVPHDLTEQNGPMCTLALPRLSPETILCQGTTCSVVRMARSRAAWEEGKLEGAFGSHPHEECDMGFCPKTTQSPKD